MDPNDLRQRALFFEVHAGLPREGPGDRSSTARALDLARPLPAAPQVLDIACGPGAQTIDLAALLPQATITAVDLHEPFVGGDQPARRDAWRSPAACARWSAT